jgi:hypothetical protein
MKENYYFVCQIEIRNLKASASLREMEAAVFGGMFLALYRTAISWKVVILILTKM